MTVILFAAALYQIAKISQDESNPTLTGCGSADVYNPPWMWLRYEVDWNASIHHIRLCRNADEWPNAIHDTKVGTTNKTCFVHTCWNNTIDTDSAEEPGMVEAAAVFLSFKA